MLITVFCRISNILKDHAFWQTIRIWFEDNFTFLGPCREGPANAPCAASWFLCWYTICSLFLKTFKVLRGGKWKRNSPHKSFDIASRIYYFFSPFIEMLLINYQIKLVSNKNKKVHILVKLLNGAVLSEFKIIPLYTLLNQ